VCLRGLVLVPRIEKDQKEKRPWPVLKTFPLFPGTFFLSSSSPFMIRACWRSTKCISMREDVTGVGEEEEERLRLLSDNVRDY